jgi:hypothetical protein
VSLLALPCGGRVVYRRLAGLAARRRLRGASRRATRRRQKHYVELLGQLLNARLALERNLLVVVLSIVLALVWGRLVMDWPMDISLYFFMQTASTIGYGDFLPSSPSQRAWYTVYMWLVVGVVASSIGVIFEHVLRAQDESFESLDKKVRRPNDLARARMERNDPAAQACRVALRCDVARETARWRSHEFDAAREQTGDQPALSSRTRAI